MRLLVPLLVFALGLAAVAQVTITKGADGAFTVAAPNYTAVVGADGNLRSLVSGGAEFLHPAERGLVGGGYVTVTEHTDGWRASAFAFDAVTPTEPNLLTATADGHTLVYTFLPDGIELRFTQTKEPYIWSYLVNPALKDMLEKESGEAVAFKTAYREGMLQVFAANGANVTFPRGATYYIAKNARAKPDTDPMLQQVWMPRTSAVPKEAFQQRLTIHATPTAADALQATIAVPAANHVFPGGAPAALGLAGTLRFPGVAIDGTADLVVTEFLSGKEVFRQKQPVKLAAGAKGTILFNVSPAPGLYRAVLTATQGEETLATRSFPFVYDMPKMALPERPADFDAFWNDTLAEQEKIPADPQLTLVKEENGVKLYKLRFAGLFDRHFNAWLSVPAKEGKYPAHVIFPPSGINATYLPNSSPNNVGLSLAIAGQEVEYPRLTSWQPDPYFRQGHDYFRTGIGRKETWYYRAVFAACSRAVDLLAARPEVDASRIFVTGGSQGGGLAFITAALNPKVGMAVSGSPGLFGLEWKLRHLPKTYWPPIDPVDEKNAYLDDPGTLEARVAVARYMDAANFAPRITCPVLICSGMQDVVTCQAAAYAAWSRLTNAPVRALLADPWGGHNGPRGGQSLSSTWWVNFAHGQPNAAYAVTETTGLPVMMEKK